MENNSVNKMLIDSTKKGWEALLQSLESLISERSFHTWFSDCHFVSFESGHLKMAFEDEFHIDWVIRHYKDTIINLGKKYLDGFSEVSFSLLEASPETENVLAFTPKSAVAKVLSPVAKKEKEAFAKGLIEAYNFDNFVGQGGFHMAYTIAQEVAHNPGQRSINPLILHGDTGLGKTHLASAIGNFCAEHGTARRVIFKTSEEFLSDFVSKIRSEAYKRSKTGYRTISDREVMGMSAELLSADLLIIDDIQFLVGKEKTQDHFCKILNSLTAMDKQVVVTCDKSPDSFKSVPGKKVQKSLDEKLLHKLRNGMSIEILKLDVETRELLLRRKIQDFRLSGYITEDVIQALTEVPLSNVRELEGVLNKLFAYKELLKRDITVDMVRIILGDTTRNMASPVTIERIIKVVSKEMEISGEMLVSMSRIQKAALPRKVAMYLCRELTDNSLHTVGLHFNRDYSTVIFNIKALVKLMQRDKDLARKIREIKEQLQNNS